MRRLGSFGVDQIEKASGPLDAVQGAEVLGQALVDSELSPVFGLLGDANMYPIIHAMELGASFYPTTHEAGAVSMAAGYALTTGKVGHATVTRGPGLANTLTALTTAVRDRAPIVVLAGGAHTYDPHGLQSIDQDTLVAPTGAVSLTVASPAELAASVAWAAKTAAARRIPVVLSVPTDFLEAEAVPQVVELGAVEEELSLQAPTPDDDQLARAIDLLRGAERPVILAGLGFIAGGASLADVETIAQATGSLLATTLPASGLFASDDFPGSAFSVGYSGGYAVATVRRLLADCDVVLALGASFNDYTTDRGKLFANATVVQVDSASSAFGKFRQADLEIHADVAEVVPKLAALAAAGTPETGYRTDEVRDVLVAARWAADMPDRSDETGIDPRTALRAVDARVGRDRHIVLDNGHFATFPAQTLRVFGTSQLIPAFGFGSIGLGLGTATGVAVGHPESTTVVVVGDGGVMISLPELETVGRLQIPMVIVVINDAAYGAEVHMLRKHGRDIEVAQFPPTDFTALAGQFGISSIRVDKPSDLDALPSSLDGLDAPLLIDVHVTMEVVADKFQ